MFATCKENEVSFRWLKHVNCKTVKIKNIIFGKVLTKTYVDTVDNRLII